MQNAVNLQRQFILTLLLICCGFSIGIYPAANSYASSNNGSSDSKSTNYKIDKSNIDTKYKSNDGKKKCTSRGVRKIDGFDIKRDCWEYSYERKVNYPSKDNCSLYEHCYFVGDGKCLFKDKLGNCVNKEKEFSCKKWDYEQLISKEAKTSLTQKHGTNSIICTGVPCIDGHCVDKSYMIDNSMMNTLAKLQAVIKMKPDSNRNFNLFAGSGIHCSKKPMSYSNCCSIKMGGWGSGLGAKCSKDEQILMESRKKNLCVYVGKVVKKKMGVVTVIKHHYCCFGNMLDKVLQVEGRKQLGMNFGSGGSTNCRGLTLEEIGKINFDKVDFSEFIAEFKANFASRYKSPNIGDLTNRVKQSIPNMKKSMQGNIDKELNK